jgi:hypothetical protein
VIEPASKADSALSTQSSPATAISPTNVVQLNAERRAEQAAEKRASARCTGGVDPGPPRASPCIGSPFVGGESPVALSRRISDAYR